MEMGNNQIKDICVYISVDMEGVCGVTAWEDVNRDGLDYGYFRQQMTEEVNAAIRGALDAGATRITIKDAHDTGRNILPGELLQPARLIRGWSGTWQSMMEGIENHYNAALFIGYHAKAGTPDATLEHTMNSRNIADVSIDGISLPEAGINALIAGIYRVPIVFIAGEKAVCNQCTNLFGNIETVAVKEGRGEASVNLHPEIAREKIRRGVKNALDNLHLYQPFTLPPPYTLKVQYKFEELVQEKSQFPGVERSGDWELTYRSDSMEDIMKLFHLLN